MPRSLSEQTEDMRAALKQIAQFARSCTETPIALSNELLKLTLANIAEHAELKSVDDSEILTKPTLVGGTN